MKHRTDIIIDNHNGSNDKLNFISGSIRQIRLHKCLSQTQMAALMDITECAYRDLENHHGAMGIHTLMNFCNATVVNIHLLLSEDINITERNVNLFNDRKLSWIIEDNQRLRAAVDFSERMIPLRKTG